MGEQAPILWIKKNSRRNGPANAKNCPLQNIQSSFICVGNKTILGIRSVIKPLFAWKVHIVKSETHFVFCEVQTALPRNGLPHPRISSAHYKQRDTFQREKPSSIGAKSRFVQKKSETRLLTALFQKSDSNSIHGLVERPRCIELPHQN